MVEELVRDNVAPLAQLSSGEICPIYDEDDLALAYPGGGGRADITIDFGETVVAFEVVSGHMKIETRLGLDLDRASFDSDMEKIVYKKLRQLDGTATNIANDPTAVLGDGARPKHFQPVVVAAGGFQLNSATSRVIDDYISTLGLFLQEGELPAVVIDLTDLEMIETLHEDGEMVVDLVEIGNSRQIDMSRSVIGLSNLETLPVPDPKEWITQPEY